VSFAGTCLTIGKDADIFAVHRSLNERLNFLKNISLRTILPKNTIKEVRQIVPIQLEVKAY
jgi:hypothetical protein